MAHKAYLLVALPQVSRYYLPWATWIPKLCHRAAASGVLIDMESRVRVRVRRDVGAIRLFPNSRFRLLSPRCRKRADLGPACCQLYGSYLWFLRIRGVPVWGLYIEL